MQEKGETSAKHVPALWLTIKNTPRVSLVALSPDHRHARMK